VSGKKNRRLKQPDANQGPRLKVDASEGGGSTQTELVRFSFRYFHTDCLGNCELAELRAFGDRLRTLSTMTWQQVMLAHRHGLGHEKIGRDQLLVPCLLSDDVSFVLSFRYGHGLDPMLGHRDGAILYVLWVSHNHDAYRG
jgi:hypothetical protein